MTVKHWIGAMTLLETLGQYNSEAFLDVDPDWRAFITDHKLYLKSISQIRTPSEELMTQMMQDIPRYLRNIGITQPIAWIVAYINDLESDIYFNQSQPLHVPSVSQISLLYQSYITTRQIKT